MNLQNIAALTDQLKTLGFENLSYPLLKRICFNPDHFLLFQKMAKGKEDLYIQLFFEKTEGSDTYVLLYYDAILQNDESFYKAQIDGIDMKKLEKELSMIDWRSAFNINENKNWSVEDKGSWENEHKIEMIINDLAKIERTENGKSISDSLKLKYWAGTSYYELFEKINPQKSKAEISQRFYCSEEQPGISIQEAYRFLQNKQLEKQIRERKKINPGPEKTAQNKPDSTSPRISLLKKKSPGRSRNISSAHSSN